MIIIAIVIGLVASLLLLPFAYKYMLGFFISFLFFAILPVYSSVSPHSTGFQNTINFNELVFFSSAIHSIFFMVIFLFKLWEYLYWTERGNFFTNNIFTFLKLSISISMLVFSYYI